MKIGMNRLAAEQIRRNRLRDGEWRVAANHRRKVTEKLLSMASPRGRLCVLGAGNSNDLELPELLRAYTEIHLVDLDDEALARGVRRQLGTADTGAMPAAEKQAGRPHHKALSQRTGEIFLHGGLDLSGIADALASRSAANDWSVPAAEDPLLRAADPTATTLPGPFDVVASTGVLSQLIEQVTSTVPGTTPWLFPLLLAVRTGHLRLAARLTARGGRGLLVSDFVSSATCRELANLEDSQLAGLVPRLIAEQNFFHGLNPGFLPSLFSTDPVLQALTESVAPCGSWLWHQKARTYAVLSLEWKRSATAVSDLTAAR